VLGQDEEELVIEQDRVINSGAKSIATFHILGDKPAPHAAVLEINIEPFGKGAVLARIVKAVLSSAL